jgi:hypothetical protein
LVELQAKTFRRLAGATASDKVKGIFERAGWNGLIGEWGEERVNSAMLAAMGEGAWEDINPGFKQGLAEAIAFAVPGAAAAVGQRIVEGPDLAAQLQKVAEGAAPAAPGEEEAPEAAEAVEVSAPSEAARGLVAAMQRENTPEGEEPAPHRLLEPRTPGQRRTNEWLGMRGLEAHPVELPSGAKVRAAHRGKTVLYDASIPDEAVIMALARHEAFHKLEDVKPAEWANVETAIEEILPGFLAESRVEYEADIGRTLSEALSAGRGVSEARSEALARSVERLSPIVDAVARDPGLIDRVSGANRNVLQRVLDAVLDALNRMLKRPTRAERREAEAAPLRAAKTIQEALDLLVVPVEERVQRQMLPEATQQPVTGVPEPARTTGEPTPGPQVGPLRTPGQRKRARQKANKLEARGDVEGAEAIRAELEAVEGLERAQRERAAGRPVAARPRREPIGRAEAAVEAYEAGEERVERFAATPADRERLEAGLVTPEASAAARAALERANLYAEDTAQDRTPDVSERQVIDSLRSVLDRYGLQVPTELRSEILAELETLGETPFAEKMRQLYETGEARFAAAPREVDPLGFYSKLEAVLDEKVQGRRATPTQVLNTLRNAGVKEEEIEWSGILDYLSDKKTVAKDELLAAVRASNVRVEEKVLGGTEASLRLSEIESIPEEEWNEELTRERDSILRGEYGPREPTRHAGYQLPGGENYRELLLTLPVPRATNRSPVSLAKELAAEIGAIWSLHRRPLRRHPERPSARPLQRAHGQRGEAGAVRGGVPVGLAPGGEEEGVWRGETTASR